MSFDTQTISQTAMAASTQGGGNAKFGIVNNVNTLGNALQIISENAKLPIEVYGTDGKQIQSYRPQG
jgi:tRNA U34 5-carboxymethylaminomethyl modifying enzyme MnmG/GidA